MAVNARVIDLGSNQQIRIKGREEEVLKVGSKSSAR
jgi:hypothetical protein